MSAPTPLLDFFKRGEVARDVRLLAAEGALAPRAHEQLGILVVLADDSNPEIRRRAEETLARIPDSALRTFLARSDVSVGLREFFGDRGIFPSEIPPIEADTDEPLVEAEEREVLAVPDENVPGDESRESLVHRLSQLGFTERLKAAIKGSREVRSILIRDPNKMISAAVLSSPRVTEPEVESFARMANVAPEILRIIGGNRAWMKNYPVLLALTKNPKTPVALSLNLMPRLTDRDLTMLSVDRNVPEPLRIAARKKVVTSATGRK